MNKITPFLWFDADAEAAAEFYLSIFPGSRRLHELRYPESGPRPAGSLLAMDLEIEGQQLTFLNGGPHNRLSDAFSLVVRCETQQEIDFYWSSLVEGGGTEKACGWLTDRFGLSWQVVPAHLSKLLRHPAAMQAMMGMKKLEIATLEEASQQAG